MKAITLLKELSREAIQQRNPCDVIYATYMGNALRIDALPIDVPLDMVNIPPALQKIEGTITCEMTEGEGVEIVSSGDVRSIKLTKVPVTIETGLNPGDHVIAARHQGGQQFSILHKY